jgi:antitoxin ParD1/3/4
MTESYHSLKATHRVPLATAPTPNPSSTMPTVEKITIALTKELATNVRKAVTAGEYASTSEVIREALRDWQLKRATREEQINEVRRLWQEGIESGSAGPLNMAAIKREARKAKGKPKAAKAAR